MTFFIIFSLIIDHLHAVGDDQRTRRLDCRAVRARAGYDCFGPKSSLILSLQFTQNWPHYILHLYMKCFGVVGDGCWRLNTQRYCFTQSSKRKNNTVECSDLSARLRNEFWFFSTPYIDVCCLYPLFSILYPPFSILHPPSFILCPLSSVLCPLSSALHPLSSILYHLFCLCSRAFWRLACRHWQYQ